VKLYELTESYNQIKELDLTEEEQQSLLDNVEGSIEDKVENVVKVIKDNEGTIEAIKNEVSRLNQMKASLTSKNDSLKRYIDTSMQIIDKDKLSAGLFKISYRKSSSLTITDESLIPVQFIKIVPETKVVDRVELKKFMKDNHVEGAVVKNKKNLQIK